MARVRTHAVAWIPAEDATLLDMRRRGEGDAAIAATLGRSEDSIASRASKLRRSGAMPVPALRFWSDDEVATLVSMREAGATTAEIGTALGRSGWAVKDKISGLMDSGVLPGHAGGVDRDHVRRIPANDPLLAALHQEYGRRSA